MGIMLNVLAAVLFLAQAPAAPAEPAPKLDAEEAREEAKKKEAEAKAIINEFRKGLKDCKTEADICSAIKTLGQMQHPKIMQELRNWLGKPSADISGAAVDELVKYKNDKNAAEALLQMAKGRKDKEGIAKCLAGVGDVGYRPVAPGLLDFLHNKDVAVCKAALQSCGQLKSKYTIDRLIALARDLDGIRTDTGVAGGYGVPSAVTIPWAGVSPQQNDDIQRKNTLLPATYDALKKITGQQWVTVKEWDLWWRQNKNQFKELD